MNKIIYLDNNATTKVSETVAEKMQPYLCELYANPSSMHDFGAEVAKGVKEARQNVKEFLGANSEKEIIFTAGGSESANMAIKGYLEANKKKKHIITTKVEHPCVLNLFHYLEKQGYETTYIGVNSHGELDLDELQKSIRPDTALVSVMWANNETGVIFPIDKIAKIVKKENPDTKIYVDAVQAAGKIPINVKDLQIDMLGISGHKIHAPKGVGALYVKAGTLLTPLIIGGHQEFGKRAGTENVQSIVGLGQAALEAMDYLKNGVEKTRYLRDKLENGILKNVFNSKLNANTQNRVPNTTNIGFEYVEGELILLHLGDLGICASSGSACTSGSLEPSHVLKAMGTPFTALHGSIRFSLSRYTTEEEIDYAIENIPAVIEKLASFSPFQEELEQLKKSKCPKECCKTGGSCPKGN